MSEKSKYKSLTEWRGADEKAYNAAIRNGLMDEICETFGWTKTVRSKTIWTKEKCLEDAKKYTYKTDWIKNSNTSTKVAKKMGWYNECCAHMIQLRKPKGYWTKEKCIEDARKYKTLREWELNGEGHSPMRYWGSVWFDECTAHMVCQKPNGYWTKERCIAEARKYKTIAEWRKVNSASYTIAVKKKEWYNECVSHMHETIKPNGYWTKERCIAEAKKYKTIAEWSLNDNISYGAARRCKCLDECYDAMGLDRRKKAAKKTIWTKEECIEDAKKYTNRTDWNKNSPRLYQYAYKHKFKECFDHMPLRSQPWTVERCIEDAKKYKTKSEWWKQTTKGYSVSKKLGCFEECTKHMV